MNVSGPVSDSAVAQVSPLPGRPVRVDVSSLHGRGVFACRPVPAGEVLEVAPVLLLDRDEVDGTAVGLHVFEWDEWTVALVLGVTSLLNHADVPSAEVRFDEETLTATLVATCDVPAGAEICISYGEAADLSAWGIGS